MKILIDFIKLDDDCSFVIHFYNLKLTFSDNIKAQLLIDTEEDNCDCVLRQRSAGSGAGRVQYRGVKRVGGMPKRVTLPSPY